LQEEVRDLLWTNSAAPRPVVTIRELPSGVSLAGASERQVHSREEMSHLLMQGTLMRAVASTNMNNRCVAWQLWKLSCSDVSNVFQQKR
jgi:hypothetical protein